VNGQIEQHPGDVYARGEIDAWYAQRTASATAGLADALGDAAAALVTAEGRARAGRRVKEAADALEELEAGRLQWSEYGVMPPEQSRRVSRVIGSIAGGLDGAFGPPIVPSASEMLLMGLGLDPGLEPDGQLAPALRSGLGLGRDESRAPTGRQLAEWEYHARWAVGYEAMGRLGLYRDGDPWPALLHAGYARECAEEDERRVATGWDPMATEDVLAAVAQAAGEPFGRLDPLPGRYPVDEASGRSYCAAAHERLVEAAATVSAIVTRFDQRVRDGDGFSRAEWFTAGLVLADLVAAARAAAQAAAFSTGSYPKVFTHIGR
jgi:hypothetical protein